MTNSIRAFFDAGVQLHGGVCTSFLSGSGRSREARPRWVSTYDAGWGGSARAWGQGPHRYHVALAWCIALGVAHRADPKTARAIIEQREIAADFRDACLPAPQLSAAEQAFIHLPAGNISH